VTTDELAEQLPDRPAGEIKATATHLARSALGFPTAAIPREQMIGAIAAAARGRWSFSSFDAEWHG
jgi:hypothetical protein